jgi:hypothetical protein
VERGLVLAFTLGHIGAIMIVAVWLAVAIEVGWPPDSLARATDVEISYGAAGVFGSATALVPHRWRAIWVGWWFGIAVLAGSGLDFTAVGHLLALMPGIALAGRLRSDPRWTPTRVILLASGVTFGYLTLTGAWVSAAPLAGLAGVCVAIAYSHVLGQKGAVVNDVVVYLTASFDRPLTARLGSRRMGGLLRLSTLLTPPTCRSSPPTMSATSRRNSTPGAARHSASKHWRKRQWQGGVKVCGGAVKEPLGPRADT